MGLLYACVCVGIKFEVLQQVALRPPSRRTATYGTDGSRLCLRRSQTVLGYIITTLNTDTER